MNRSNLVFVVEDTNNNKFGCYLPVKIDRYGTDVPGNKDMFLFSLKSNGRINGMMKFEWKSGRGYHLLNKSYDQLIRLGGGSDLGLRKQNYKSQCWILQRNDCFEYHGISNALCGKTGNPAFECRRITVIQMQ